jgi:hypothetical protein
MNVSPEDAADVDKARKHVRLCADKAHQLGLERAFVGHALLAESMKMFFNCDNERSNALASGLMVIAFADERSDTKDGCVLAEYILSRAVNNPQVIDDFRRLAGMNAVANLNGVKQS